MKIFVYNHECGQYCLHEEYFENVLIIAESLEAVIELMFNALYYGKEGTFSDSFPCSLDYNYQGGKKEWEDDFKEELISCLKSYDEIHEVVGVEVPAETRPGIYRNGKYWEYERG